MLHKFIPYLPYLDIFIIDEKQVEYKVLVGCYFRKLKLSIQLLQIIIIFIYL